MTATEKENVIILINAEKANGKIQQRFIIKTQQTKKENSAI